MSVSLLTLAWLSIVSLCVLISVEAASPEAPYHFKVGNVDIWKVQDASTPAPYAFFFPTLTTADWAPFVDSTGTPYINSQGQFLNYVSFSGTLIHSQDTWILVDDGIGVVVPIVPTNQTNRIPALIKLAGVDPTNLNYIVSSHFHTDHTGWNVFADSMKNFILEFPNAKFIAQQDEITYWTSSPALKNASHYRELLQPFVNAGLLTGVTGTTSLTGEVTLVPCKGHTPGHQCVIIRSAGQSAFIISDAMHHPVQVQRPDWSATFDWDVTFSVPTRTELIGQIVLENAILIAPHFEFPGIGNLVQDLAVGNGRSGFIYVPLK